MKGKNQHFVPRFYLNKFSIDGADAAVKAYIVDARKFVDIASIRNQAAKDNYYGPADDLNSVVETKLGILLNRIIKNKTTYSKKGLVKRIELVAHLDLRNPVRINGFKKLAENVGERFRKEVEAGLHDLRYPFVDAAKMRALMLQVIDSKVPEMKERVVAQLLSGGYKVANLIDDVQVTMLVNNTRFPFVTSDHPTAMYNQFFEGIGLTNVSGYGNKGVQLFLPITPKLLMMIYDKKAYKLEGLMNGQVTLSEEEDVHQLNLLQIYNCTSAIYCNEQFSSTYADDLILKMTTQRDRGPNQMSITLFKMTLSFVKPTRVVGYNYPTKSGRFDQLRKHTNYNNIFNL